MRIAIEVRALHHSLRGSGQWRYAHNLLRHIAQQDNHNEFCFFAPHSAPELDLPPMPPTFRFQYRALPLPPFNERQWLWDQVLVPAFLWRHRTAVCHFLLQTATLWKPCRFVVTAYDAMAELFPEYGHVRRSKAYRVQTWAIRRADCLAAISQNTRRDLVRLRGVDERRITVVPLAADSVFRPLANVSESERIRRKYDLPARIVLSVFSHELRKNTLGIIHAFAQFVKNTGAPHALALFGDRGFGLERDAFERALAETGAGERVRLVGRVPDEELAALYGLAEFFVFPSFYEGFGLPVLEALACGTPVVASDASSLPEIVGNAGLLVDVRSVNALAGAMTALAADSVRRKALRGHALARSRLFSWEATARATLQVYRELAHEGPTRL